MDSLAALLPAGLQSVFDALAEAVVAVDRALEVRAWNRAAVELFGGRIEDSVGQSACALFGEGACPVDCLQATLDHGRPIVDYQTTILAGDGAAREVLLRTVSLGSEGVAILLRDVTEVTDLRKSSVPRDGFGGMIGSERRMLELYGLIESVGPTDATVLIRGESGTGKELVARALHFESARADGPFVPVNCSALSETLLESELFGHVRGAFTGAVADREGRFEQARGGTIFLDEIGDVSPVVQVKLLRVLQERMVERVGDGRSLPVDVRVVAATNKNLEELMARGLFREDFYYRIRVVTLTVPPLRERSGDIPALVDHFLVRHGAAPERLSASALARLMHHFWPGNVRELENAVEHAAVLARGGPIGPEHLPPDLTGRAQASPATEPDDERARILAALEHQRWHRTRTARALGMDRSTLWRKMKQYGLSDDEERR